MEKIVRSIEKKNEYFRDKSYYDAFERFKNNLTQIKEYCKSVSILKGYKSFSFETDVKNRFEQLRDDFNRCITDLNFVFEVSNAFDKKESQKIDKSLKEVKESLEQLDDKLNEFYEHSRVNSSKLMNIEWAERRNLREVYEKHDIPWTRKIQIAKDILLGLLFLRTVNVFHHDVRCENVFVLRNLSVKLGNFACPSRINGLSSHIVRCMAPELIKQYKGYYIHKRVYTINCEIFSVGMLLWELCYEKLPYAEWNLKQITDHVLSGKREKILKRKFRNIDNREIQLEFINFIQYVWRHQPELRITIPALIQRLKELANKFPIPLDAPSFFKNKELDIDGQKSGESTPKINDCSEIEEEVPEEVVVIPLKEGIDMHKKKEYKSSWECFKQNAELGDPLAKFWIGYYLLYGYHGEKDPIMARNYFKESADESNHAESQCRYAVSLLGDLAKETDETVKDKLRKEILYYFELAAENPENRNADAMYYLGDIYVGGKLRVKRDVIRGLNYLRLAANKHNERALKKLGK
ncbi:kinase-like protein [Gigaspora margarita]|uniref:Kinase-like protein n=2 Tax=Gigaspora margarita TaxID=4874 RepID=A0A8H4AHC6_GIGMA|nr:kinase-like protein [Gigaspora margarita]